MEKSKNNFREVLLALALLVLALLLGIFIEGLFRTGDGTPWEPEEVEIIDSCAVADSTVTLVRLRERHAGLNPGTYFLTYRKNWITGKQKRMRLDMVGDEPYHTAVVTPLAEYAVTITKDDIQVGEVKKRLNWGEFCRAYGTGTLTCLTVLTGISIGRRRERNKDSTAS